MTNFPFTRQVFLVVLALLDPKGPLSDLLESACLELDAFENASDSALDEVDLG